MAELQDLHGESISWMVSRRKPLLCAVSQGAEKLGSLVQGIEGAPIHVALASIRWRLDTQFRFDTLSFDGSSVEIAHAGGSKQYDALIDGVYRYRLEWDWHEGRAAWEDSALRTAMVFRRHLHSLQNESGEIVVSNVSQL